MKSLIVAGLALIALGLVAFAYRGVTYTTREKVVDIGPVEATTKTDKTIPLPPIVGGLALGTGILLVLVGARRS